MLTMCAVKLLADFWYKATKEQLTGVISLGCVFVLSLICLFAQVSIPAFNFTLPQVKLGIALLIVGLVFALLALLAFHRSQRVALQRRADESEDPLFAVRAVMPEEPKIRIQVTGEGEGMSFWKNGETGHLNVYLDVVNFTSAAVKIDRILGDVTLANSAVVQFSHFKKQTVAAVSAARVYVQAELSAEHLKKVDFHLQKERQPAAGLNLTVYLVTEKGEIELHPRLSTGNCRFANFQIRTHA